MSEHAVYTATVAQVTALQAEVKQLRQSVTDYRQAADDNLDAARLALADNTSLRIDLGEILVVVNAATENTAIECHVRVIATQAMYGKGDRVTLAVGGQHEANTRTGREVA